MEKTRFSFAAFAAFTILSLGLNAFAEPLEPVSASERDTRAKDLAYIPFTGKPKERLQGKTNTCLRSLVTLSVTDATTKKARAISFELYRPNVRRKTPLVMVLPTIAGVTVLEPKIARTLCDASYTAAIVDPYTLPLPTDPIPFGYEDERMKFAVQTLRSVLDFASRDPRTNPKKLAAIGLSLGASPAALLAALEPERVKALVLVAGGGNLPHIFAKSTSARVRKLRELRMKAHSIDSDAKYEAELVSSLKYDPIHFAPIVKKDHVLMFMAEKDNIIPTETQIELFNAMGEPNYVNISSGHVGTLLAVTYLYFDAVMGFLDMRFGDSSVFKGIGNRAPAPVDQLPEIPELEQP